jgi:hypothetical protein
MKVFFAALVIFLLAFAGLATGLILRRKALRGGCGSASGSGRDCQCKTATAPDKQVENGRCTQGDKSLEGED